jgi:hypothetical protein
MGRPRHQRLRWNSGYRWGDFSDYVFAGIPSSSRVHDIAKRSVFRSEIPKRLDMLEDKDSSHAPRMNVLAFDGQGFSLVD